MPAPSISAELIGEEAILRFPYDDALRRLLRAIPGRRWDAQERAWRIPLGPGQARALSCMLDRLPGEHVVSEELGRAIHRRRARSGAGALHVDLARPDERWWLSFSSEPLGVATRTLLEHPDARELTTIGRAIVPLDEAAAASLSELASAGRVELSEPAARALAARAGTGEPAAGEAAPIQRFAAELRRDRRGGHWIVLEAALAAPARALAERLGLRWREARGGAVALATQEREAELLAELLERLSPVSIDSRVAAWLARARSWRGTVDVGGSADAPVFFLLGDRERLPRPLRDLAGGVPGGASVPLTSRSWALIEERLEGWLTPAARRCGRAVAAGAPPPPAVLELSTVHDEPTFVLAPGHDEGIDARFAALPGARPAPAIRRGGGEHAQLPAIAADAFSVPALDEFLLDGAAWVADEALPLLQDIREEHARSAGLVALSAAHDAPLRVERLAGELKPFQRAGVSYLLARRRSFLADEQGLGKTMQALASIEAADAFPAVVVCPASLKLNWLRELTSWLPHRRVVVLAGNGRREGEEDAEIVIVNYDVLAARLPELSERCPRALVLDESHYCKNPSAKRTQAAQALAAAVPAEGLVLALTGTPVTNRPAELIPQLRILGRLAEFGSGAQFGERFRGPDAHLRLHWHLRARCMVRRCKAEVLPQLPAKTRSVVPIELDNEAEYRLAERDLVAWLATQPLDLRELDARVAATLRAERLVRVGALKLLAARGKLGAALAWMHDFRSSGERLVVFARHREVQRAVLERFPDALHILGTDSQGGRERALAAFAEGDGPGNQMIVCSIDVAGHGLTLTRSSNVAFLELEWTPAKHDQAEDRCHRIGQQAAVNCYYLLAAGTIDESIATLLERKRAVIGAVTDGREQDEESIVDALVRELRGAPFRHLRAVA